MLISFASINLQVNYIYSATMGASTQGTVILGVVNANRFAVTDLSSRVLRCYTGATNTINFDK